MSKKQNISSFAPSSLNPKAAKLLAEIDKIIRNVTDEEKGNLIEKGLSLKPLKRGVIKTVKIKEIVTSAFFIRSKVHDSFDDLDIITELDPIKIATTEDKELYFLIDGERRLEHAKRNGEKKIEVQTIGTVVCQSQIGMARGKEVVKFKKPLTPLELAHGLMQLRDQIIRDFGENAFFSHGGDRKTNHETKQSLPDYIAKVLGLKKSTVDALLRFGSNIGPLALAGLLTKKDMLGMALRKINQINAGLKDANLPEQISDRANKLLEAGATQNNLIDEAGELASKKIFQALNKHMSEDNDNNDDDSKGETESNDMPRTTKCIHKHKNAENDGDESDTISKKNKIKPDKIVKIISDMQTELKKLKKNFEDCKCIDEIDQRVVEARWNRLESFWGELCCKLGDAGLH